MMFKFLRNCLRRRFTTKAWLETEKNLDYLFNSDEAEGRYLSVRALKKGGLNRTQEFRSHVIETVLQIVQSDNPGVAMRKKLISNIQADCFYRLTLAKEFYDRRQVIHNEFNKGIADPKARLSDDTVARRAIWTEAESLCLRLLQASMFKESSCEDWRAPYVKLYEELLTNTFRSIIAKKGRDSRSNYPLMVKHLQYAINDFERRVTEVSK